VCFVEKIDRNFHTKKSSTNNYDVVVDYISFCFLFDDLLVEEREN